MHADPFTSADPLFTRATIKGARHLPLAAFEVAESGHRSSWWLVAIAVAVVAVGLFLLERTVS